MINSKYISCILDKFKIHGKIEFDILHNVTGSLKAFLSSEKERKKIGSLKRLVKISGKFILIYISSSYHFDSRMTWNKKRTC